MAKIDKHLERLRRRPPEASFADVRAVLEARGWFEVRQKGSHITFTKPGEPVIVTISLTGKDKVKRFLLDKYSEQLGLDEV